MSTKDRIHLRALKLALDEIKRCSYVRYVNNPKKLIETAKNKGIYLSWEKGLLTYSNIGQLTLF